MNKVVSISKAYYLKDYQIEFKFDDDSAQVIDFGPFLKSARNPMIKKYLNKKVFKSFSIVHGDLIWNDYELCFPIWDLYTNNILKSTGASSAQ